MACGFPIPVSSPALPGLHLKSFPLDLEPSAHHPPVAHSPSIHPPTIYTPAQLPSVRPSQAISPSHLTWKTPPHTPESPTHTSQLNVPHAGAGATPLVMAQFPPMPSILESPYVMTS